MSSPVPLSLYIHLPWCVRKCPYCDFNSHALRGELPETLYIQALTEDLKLEQENAYGRVIQSIFFGGGTPSLFSPRGIKQILDTCANYFSLAPNAEITLEANPGTVEQARFKGFRDAGINRISLGIQSFNAQHLKALGRIHDGNEAKRAIEALDSAGFTHFNLDLMFGLPEQTIEEGMNDLMTALQFSPPHLSWYQLTLEPNTLFYQKPPKLPNEENSWKLQQQGQQLLKEYGFQHYEISAYGLPAHQCKHNLNYWEFGDYLGIGAGAHGKVTFPSGEIKRYWKVRHPKDYLNLEKKFLEGEKQITEKELPLEFMLNALRLYQPISFDLFQHRTGLAVSAIKPQLEKAAQNDLLILKGNHFYPSEKGHLFLNNLLELFL